MFLEWLLERRKPGPVGHIDGPPGRWTGHAGLFRGLLAVAVLGLWAWYIVSGWPDSGDRWIAAVMTTIYLGVAYEAAPRPNLSNVGLWGTPIDHPFRFTDDINRLQAFLMVFLAPGRVVSAGLVDLVHLARSGRLD